MDIGELQAEVAERYERLGLDGGLPVAQIASLWPGPALASEPGCGCDACDDGSAYYLEQIDDAIAGLVGGPTVILQGAGWHHIWQPRAGSGSGYPTIQNPRGQCASLARGEDVELPPGVEAYVGRSWLG